MSILAISAIVVFILLFSIFVGAPVAFALGFTAAASIVLFIEPSQLANIGAIAFKQTTSINQLVIPLFVLMAEILAQGGVATDIYSVLNKWLKRFKGGLAITATLASTIFAALCGSSPATAATIGRISVKEMTDSGYKGSFAAGTVVAGGTLGIMIPPSIAFVTYGIITETSIVKLLMAGLLPGLMMSAILCISIIIRTRINPDLVGEVKGEISESKQSYKYNRSELPGDLRTLLPSAILISVVLGGMYTGVATATESAAIGCIGAFVIVIAHKRLTKKMFTDILCNTMKTSTMIMFLVLCGLALSYAISFIGIPQYLTNLITATGASKWTIMILLYVLWFILGCLMDPGSMIVLTIPFIFPTLIELGFDPIWVGVVSTLCVEIGMITPPVGLNLFVLRSVSDVPMKDIIVGSIPYVFILIFCLVILSIFPQISLFLPSGM